MFGERLRETRKSREMTLSDLSKKSGLSILTISNAERGLSSIRINNFLKLCDALEISPKRFFAHDNDYMEYQVFSNFCNIIGEEGKKKLFQGINVVFSSMTMEQFMEKHNIEPLHNHNETIVY